MEQELQEAIKALVEKSSSSNDSGDAMRYSQAATNIAHLMNMMGAWPKEQKK